MPASTKRPSLDVDFWLPVLGQNRIVFVNGDPDNGDKDVHMAYTPDLALIIMADRAHRFHRRDGRVKPTLVNFYYEDEPGKDQYKIVRLEILKPDLVTTTVDSLRGYKRYELAGGIVILSSLPPPEKNTPRGGGGGIS